jgi:TonB-dependent starch-binding outer membrane protein SusC
MKQSFLKVTAALTALCVSAVAAFSQGRTVSGKVTDDTGEPMVGMTVFVTGTTTGVPVDIDGNYSIKVTDGESLTFSYLGYRTQVIVVNGQSRIDVQLAPDTEMLGDAVVIGYGTTTKKDLTGSVSAVSSKDFNNGLVSSPEQLINGKVAGVQIMSSSGSPTSGSTIRIRGGASLNASNDPLIVLDGIPLEIGGISGNDGNFLSLINPADIESMTVLKDASSTAIYGSRASNGVIIITTKKGSNNRITVNVNSTQSIQWKTRLADILSTDEFIGVVNGLDDSYTSLLGTDRTDWNSQIYTPAFGTDNLVSVNGRMAENVPFRASVGYYNQDGILKSDNAQRATANFSVNPSFFDDYLKLGFNVKGAYNKNHFAPTTAIWNAATFNPTLPVYSGQDYLGGYTEIETAGVPNPDAVKNPLGLINQTDAQSTVYRVIANTELDYRMHFLPDLKLHLAYGYDYAQGEGYTSIPETAASNYDQKGYYAPYGPARKHNSLFTAYLNYSTDVDKLRIDVTAGYDSQYWKSTTSAGDIYNAAGESLNGAYKAYDYRHSLMSYYGRVNLSYDSRYLLTATVRRDGTSRFSPSTRWGTFPSVALAWNIAQEEFLADSGVLSDLKLRASYGVTGQQDGIGDYNYLPVYYEGSANSQYIGANDSFITTWLPSTYVSDLKWETTKSWNFGFDYGFLDDRISGSVDYYTRKTEDLLATVPTAGGTNFTKTITTNVGNMESSGIEATVNLIPVQTRDFTWNVGANLTWQNVKITNLTLVDNGKVTQTLVGPTIDSKYVQVMTEGQAPYSFFVYKQLYDTEGRPIEGAYADLNNDGVITMDDRYCYHSPAADILLGFNTSLTWKNLTVSAAFRGSIGNYVYNAMAVNTGALETMKYSAPQLSNLHSSYLETGFKTRQFYSDYYVENASFLKMDNLTVSYNFGRVKNLCGIRVSALLQNVFTITKYSGVDPEVPNGFDSSFYPRPRIFSLSLGLEF